MPVYGYPMTTNSKLTIERFFTGALKPGMAFLGEDDMLTRQGPVGCESYLT